MNDEKDMIEIDFRELCSLLYHYLWVIILCAAVTGTAAFMTAHFLMAPQYDATTKVYILSKQNGDTLTYSDVQLGTQLTKDYAELITSRFVLEQVIRERGMDEDYEAFKRRIEVETPADTRILAITVTDTDPAIAKELADSIRDAAAKHITNVMDVEAVNVVENANYPSEPSRPNVGLLTVLGVLLGLFLSIGTLVIKYMLDDSIKTSEDVEHYLNLSILALIPIMENEKSHKGKTGKHRKRIKKTKILKHTAPVGIEREDTPAEQEPAKSVRTAEIGR